jgi:hypothetical protein
MKSIAFGMALAIVLGLTGTVLIPKDAIASDMGTTERDWMTDGSKVSIKGNGLAQNIIYKYIKVNASDNITVNWESGGITYNDNFAVWLDTTCLALNFSTRSTDGSGIYEDCPGSHGYPHFYMWNSYSMPSPNVASPPQTLMWVRSSSQDIFQLQINIQPQCPVNTLNITISPGKDNRLTKLENQVANLSSELNSTKSQLNSLNDQLSQLAINESADITRLQSMIETIHSSLDQTIMELWLAIGDNNTILMDQLVSNMTELTDQLEFLNSTLNDRISNISEYNGSSLWDAITNIRQSIDNISLLNQTIINQTLINQTLLNQTVVNQTVDNRTIVQPVTYVNKTIEKTLPTDYVLPTIAGIIAGVISGLAAAVILARKQKPQIIYMKNVEPPEELKEKMMNVRKLQAQESESEVSAEDIERKR